MKKELIVSCIALMLSFSGCSDDVPAAETESHVLVAGYYGGIPALWKDSTLTILSTKTGKATGVAAIGNDIYVCGNIVDAANPNPYFPHAVVWKNGIQTTLNSGNLSAFAWNISVFGRDYYVSGYDHEGFNYRPRIWKNGNLLPPLDTMGIGSCEAKDVVVSNNDLFVVGYVGNTNGTVVWKNGSILFSLTGLPGAGAESLSRGLFIKGSDVYTCGGGKVWKNDQELFLTVSPTFSHCHPQSVFVSDQGDVYVAGYQRASSQFSPIATVWKNGMPLALTDGSVMCEAKDVFIKDNDVYVVGYDATDPLGVRVATLWKNGVKISLWRQASEAYSIFISN